MSRRRGWDRRALPASSARRSGQGLARLCRRPPAGGGRAVGIRRPPWAGGGGGRRPGGRPRSGASILPPAMPETVMDKLVSLAKRRGFVFQSSEIYGGLGSVWDYGPLGVELKKNIKERWWRSMVHEREYIEGLDAAILMHPKVWEASGHLAGFSDPLVDCRHCKNRFRADDPRIKGTPGQPAPQCPACGSRGTLTAPRMFNLMFKTFMGPLEEAAAVVYLRPETAQGIYVNYLNVLQSARQ